MDCGTENYLRSNNRELTVRIRPFVLEQIAVFPFVVADAHYSLRQHHPQWNIKMID